MSQRERMNEQVQKDDDNEESRRGPEFFRTESNKKNNLFGLAKHWQAKQACQDYLLARPPASQPDRTLTCWLAAG